MADNITKISSEYDMVSIMQEIGANYFGSDLSTQRVGMFGYLTESAAHAFGAAVIDSSIRSNEYNVSTANRMETLLHEAANYGIELSNAIPTTMTAYIGIRTSNIISPAHEGGFAKAEENPNYINHPTYTIVIEKDAVVNIANYDFMFEYDIEIKAIWSGTAEKYVYSVRYLSEGDTEELSNGDTYVYPKEDTITKLSNKYIQSYVSTRNGITLLLFRVNLKQMTKSTEYYTVIKNDMISLTGIDFLYTDMLSHFNVYYKQNGRSTWTYVKPVSIYDKRNYDENVIHYNIIHEESRLVLNIDDFTPDYNSEFRIDIYTTRGRETNNLVYSGDGSDISISLNSFEERHSYAGLELACIPINAGNDGEDIQSIEELRNKIIVMKSSLNSLDTEYDLYNFIKSKDDTNDYVFIKKRSDAIERRYSTFTIPRLITDDIIPTSTLNACIPLSKLYPISDIEYPDSNIVTIKAGTPFIINKDEITEDGSGQKYSNNQVYNSIIRCIKQEYEYKPNEDGTIDDSNKTIKFYQDTTLMALDRSITEKDANNNDVYIYDTPEKVAELEKTIVNGSFRKVYTLPYTIAYDKINQLTSFYLTSVNRNVYMSMTDEERETVVNFAIDHFKISRNATKGENSYKISVSIMPNGDDTKALNMLDSNIIMLKGFIYSPIDDATVDGYFDFKFESYLDGVYTYSSEIVIDDSLDSSSSKTNMTNLHILSNLEISNPATLKQYDSFSKYSEYSVNENPMYLNMDVFSTRIGIGVYYADYNETISDGYTIKSIDDVISPLIDSTSSKPYCAYTETVGSSGKIKYPQFVRKFKYGKTDEEDKESVVKYVLTNVYDNANDIVSLYTDMTDFIRSTSLIHRFENMTSFVPDKNGKYYITKDGSYKYINPVNPDDPNFSDTIDGMVLNLGDAYTADIDTTAVDFWYNKYNEYWECASVPYGDGNIYICSDADGNYETSDKKIITKYEKGSEEYNDLKNIYPEDEGYEIVSDPSIFEEGYVITDTRYSHVDSCDFLILEDVPVVQYSKGIDETVSERLIDILADSKLYLDEINNRITNNFSLDYKFFRTYGPCRYFNLSTVNGEDIMITDGSTKIYDGVIGLGNLDISIEFNMLIRNGLSISDSEVVQKLKAHIKSYIENLNNETSDYTIYMSNIITELETKFSEFIKSIELISINGKPDVYRVLRYELPEELKDTSYRINSSRDNIKEYVPEYINVPLDNITINVTRTKY